MEEFLKTIQQIQTEINTQKPNSSLLINTIIIQKQYLVYYVYRVICTHFDYFFSLYLGKYIKNINTKLEISSNYKFVCYPLANRMTTDEAKLDNIFKEMINLFTTTISKVKELNRSPNEELENFLKQKTYNTIIRDIKKIVKMVPNLSKYTYYT